MAALNLTSTLLMGLVLLVIVATLTHIRNWQRGSASVIRERSTGGFLTRTIHNPTTWVVAFLIVTFGFTAGAIAVVGGVSIPDSSRQTIGIGVAAAFGLLLVGYFFYGIYLSARNRGLNSAPALGVTSLVIGLVFLIAVVIQLILA